MAAHSVNILIEMVKEIPCLPNKERVAAFVSRYKFALDYAPGMSILDFEDYRVLHAGLDSFLSSVPDRPAFDHWHIEVREATLVALQHQLSEWSALGKPSSCEDWRQAKYPSDIG